MAPHLKGFIFPLLEVVVISGQGPRWWKTFFSFRVGFTYIGNHFFLFLRSALSQMLLESLILLTIISFLWIYLRIILAKQMSIFIFITLQFLMKGLNKKVSCTSLNLALHLNVDLDNLSHPVYLKLYLNIIALRPNHDMIAYNSVFSVNLCGVKNVIHFTILAASALFSATLQRSFCILHDKSLCIE